jgi:hypothetical protein
VDRLVTTQRTNPSRSSAAPGAPSGVGETSGPWRR